MDEPIGLIAGQGRLPILTAQGIRAAGRRVVCVGLREQFDPELPSHCDQFATAGIIQLGRWIRLLTRFEASSAVMVGRVGKVRIYHPLRWFTQLPDLRAIRLWFGRLRYDKRNDAILRAVADELKLGGITLIDSTQYIPEQMAGPGVLTRTAPTAAQRADISFGLPIVQRMGDLDVGQAIAVKEGDVLAVEAIEGTDRMIERAGQLCRMGGWTLLKIAKPAQDMRFDVPTIGLKTIENLQAAGAKCLAVESGRTILLDKPKLIEAADKAGICIVGLELPVQPSSD